VTSSPSGNNFFLISCTSTSLSPPANPTTNASSKQHVAAVNQSIFGKKKQRLPGNAWNFEALNVLRKSWLGVSSIQKIRFRRLNLQFPKPKLRKIPGPNHRLQ